MQGQKSLCAYTRNVLNSEHLGEQSSVCLLANMCLIQSNLDYPNPFGQLQNISVQISKKVWIMESIFDVWLTIPTPISYSVYYRLTE